MHLGGQVTKSVGSAMNAEEAQGLEKGDGV